jgi:predicted nucleic acid-binding protein
VGYLLDTCLVSEIWKPAPNRGVVEWLASSDEDELFVSVLCLGEIRKGIGAVPDGKKKDRLIRDYALLRSRFSSRVLPVTDQAAERWGDLAAGASRAGRHLHVVDGLVAATALVFGQSLVTRNVADFATTPVPLVNPWT